MELAFYEGINWQEGWMWAVGSSNSLLSGFGNAEDLLHLYESNPFSLNFMNLVAHKYQFLKLQTATPHTPSFHGFLIASQWKVKAIMPEFEQSPKS